MNNQKNLILLDMQFVKKMIVFLPLSLLGLFCIFIVFVRFVPSFGGDLTAPQKEKFKSLPNFQNGKFINRKDVPEKFTFSRYVELGYTFFTTKTENGTPNQPPEIISIAPEALEQFSGTRLFWMGHSTFFVQHKGHTLLIDPMLGNVPAPLDFLGGKRFNKQLPIEPENLPNIDFVVFSHDHYDHLDYETILKIKDKVKWFITPLGVGNHLKRWGVTKDKIIELNWWDKKTLGELNFICTPAQHFSGRKFSNGQETLWASWVIQSDSLSLYFSGDSGYDIHFKEIGQKYGPFDLALLECGQYNTLWPDVHMFPNETVQAGIDLQAKKIIPIHWGAFKLALHPWNEPANVVLQEAQKNNLPIEIPKIGQPLSIDTTKIPLDPWWR